MRFTIRTALLVALIASAPARGDVPQPAQLMRATTLTFAGGAGDARGDVNADGLATAADLVGLFLGLTSPAQPGPYGVGLQRMTFTKPSATDPSVMRQLVTDIWYPAAPGTGPIDRRPGGRLNAPLAVGLADLPLVLFSHGSCGFQEQSIFLTSTLASHGFVVAAPPHPGNTISDFATCGTAQAAADSAANRPADISFVIDALLALAADPSSFFYHVIDPTRVGMSGHSFGGYTTLIVAAHDARVIAGVALAPAARGIDSTIAGIQLPMMIQDGSIDTVTPFATNARHAFQLLAPPKYLVEIMRAGHYAFSDLCVLSASGECGTPAVLTQDEAHAYVLRWAIPFLTHWVAKDDRYDPFLTPAITPPGAILTADLNP